MVALTDQCQMKRIYRRFGLNWKWQLYFCSIMANIFAWKEQIRLLWFLANIILKLEEEPLLQNIIQEGSCIVVVDVYKRLFLRYLQSSKLYYCRWTCGYRLYVFSLVSLSIDISIENCMMRMRMPHWRSFLFLGCVGFLRILDFCNILQ